LRKKERKREERGNRERDRERERKRERKRERDREDEDILTNIPVITAEFKAPVLAQVTIDFTLQQFAFATLV
jgi:hypothetical protein